MFSKDPEAHQQHIHQVLQQLGFAIFLNVSSVTTAVWQTLTTLTSTSTQFHWTPEEEAAFRELKLHFCSDPNPAQPRTPVRRRGGCLNTIG